MLPRADFPRRWRKRGNTEVAEKKPIGEEKIVTVAGLLLIRGLRIQSQPRCYKWTRRPEPIWCLSSSNGDQFRVGKNQVEPKRKRKCQVREERDEMTPMPTATVTNFVKACCNEVNLKLIISFWNSNNCSGKYAENIIFWKYFSCCLLNNAT